MEDDREEQESLTADELLALLTGKCIHEVQLGCVMGLLGLATAHAGGRLQFKLDGLNALNSRGVGIVIDRAAGIATVGLLDVPCGEGDGSIELTHIAPAARH